LKNNPSWIDRHYTKLEKLQNFQRMQIVCFLLLLYSSAEWRMHSGMKFRATIST
jgi:hypothetical protein